MRRSTVAENIGGEFNLAVEPKITIARILAARYRIVIRVRI